MMVVEDGDDDLGSGWFQVKKKHRSSSKFSIRNWVGGSSRQQANGRSKDSDSKNRPHISKPGKDCVPRSVAGHSSTSKEDRKDECCLTNQAVDGGNVSVETAPHKIITTTTSESTSFCNGSLPEKKPDIMHKIKWGDLDEDLLTPNDGIPAVSEIRFGKIGDDDLATCDLSTCNSSKDICLVSKDIVEVINVASDTCPNMLIPVEDSLVENYKEVSEVASNSVEILSNTGTPSDPCRTANNMDDNEMANDDACSTASNEARDSCRTASNEARDSCHTASNEAIDSCCTANDLDVKEIASDNVEPVDNDLSVLELPCSSDERSTETVELTSPVLNANVDDTGSSSVKIGRGDVEVIIVEDPEVSQSEQCRLEAHMSSNSAVADDKSVPNVTSEDSSLTTPFMNTVGEREEGESKERFRERLWSFLFENLNRAVDELYLLCELECDLEQVKEAILVLQEAESDFRELNTRVEEFDKMKKISFQSTGGAVLSMKGDHRRPHALSWEVRRMTTSPHRAEILSSSLEAFKKVQEERAKERTSGEASVIGSQFPTCSSVPAGAHNRPIVSDTSESGSRLRRKSGIGDSSSVNMSRERRGTDSGRSSRLSVQNGSLSPSSLDPNASVNMNRERRGSDSGRSSKTLVQNGRLSPSTSDPNASINRSRERRGTDSGRTTKILVQNGRLSLSTSDLNTNKLPPRILSATSLGGKGRAEQLGSSIESEKHSDSGERLRRHSGASEKDKERDRRKSQSWKPVDAWKEKRNWEEILATPCRYSSRLSYPPCMSRKSAERARILHDKLMSPDKRKKTALDLKKEAEEKHARATRIRNELESERIQKLQRTSEKLNRASERQAVRSMKLKEGMHARHQQSESRHEAYIAKVVKRAGDESNKVNEVRFITSLNEENKKYLLRQKLHDSELRRAEKFQVLKTKQKEDVAREEAVMERRKLIEAEKLQRLAETQKRKEEALLRREEERKASSAAREARAMEQLRRKEERAKAQQEEAELLAQRLAERLRESEQRRKVYLEQIRERASMDFRDQSSPLMRRMVYREGQGRSTTPSNVDDLQENTSVGCENFSAVNAGTGMQQSLKRRIKKIRQRLMALKHDLPEIPVTENTGIGHRTVMATARAKIGRWLQELQRLRQERKEGAASIGLISAEMIKFLEGKELELLASRRAGLLDFISSALPASHVSKPEASQVTIYLLRLLKVLLFLPANRSYFLSQNLLPPLIPMLLAALETYIRIGASLNVSGSSTSQLTKTTENFDSISEVLDGFLCIVTMIIGFPTLDERQRQMQDGLLELVVCYQIIHRLRDLFALYDRPQVEGSPFPSSILLSINLLEVLTSRPCDVSSINWECTPVSENEADESCLLNDSWNELQQPSSVGNVDLSLPSVVQEADHLGELHKKEPEEDSKLDGEAIKLDEQTNSIESNGNNNETGVGLESQKALETNIPTLKISLKEDKNGVGTRNEQSKGFKQPHAFVLSAISETGLVSLPSLLTAVLLQANSKSSEQGSYVLPSNFEEIATGVLKVLNNLALMDITFMQQMLARPDLKTEFFHIMSFLLTHCTNSWKVATDQVGLLLLESLLLLSYFSLFHLGNQAVLRWGNSPTILHKVCDLPFAFFSDPELMPILAGTLVSACFGCEQNKDVVQQELSTDMILSLVKSSRSISPPARSTSPTDNLVAEDSTASSTLEPRRPQSDVVVKPIRSTARNSRPSTVKSGATSGSITRVGKLRNPKDSRASKFPEDATSKLKSDAPGEAPVTLSLFARFPESFIERAEQFFSVETSYGGQDAAV
ncbi:hypothetical protein vseg_017170 [Gypsophila vaccaria]